MPNPALEQVRQPMARNISYPTNPASRSDSTNSNPFPGRGPMIQSIRRSSSVQRGAPIQSIRTSRSNSREPSIPEPVSSSRSESGSSLNSDDRTLVVKFDNNDLISHFLSSRFFQSGVNHPCKVKVHNGFAEVVFPSASDAKLASGSRSLVIKGQIEIKPGNLDVVCGFLLVSTKLVVRTERPVISGLMSLEHCKIV